MDVIDIIYVIYIIDVIEIIDVFGVIADWTLFMLLMVFYPKSQPSGCVSSKISAF